MSEMHARRTFDGDIVMANHIEVVPTLCECPKCNESVEDMLDFIIGTDDWIQCQSCGFEYRLP